MIGDQESETQQPEEQHAGTFAVLAVGAGQGLSALPGVSALQTLQRQAVFLGAQLWTLSPSPWSLSWAGWAQDLAHFMIRVMSPHPPPDCLDAQPQGLGLLAHVDVGRPAVGGTDLFGGRVHSGPVGVIGVEAVGLSGVVLLDGVGDHGVLI